MRTVLIVAIGLSFLSADLTKVNNVVQDSETGLVWQDNSDVSSTKHTWESAITYCEALTLDGYNEWRLPNINELKSIIDRSKSIPAIQGDAFEHLDYEYSDLYWSSTTFEPTKYEAWFANFRLGQIGGHNSSADKATSNFVRCVTDQ